MKILIAPNTFKGSIISKEASSVLARGIKKFNSFIEVQQIPVADGGLGTVEIITKYLGGKFIVSKTTDSLGKKIAAKYGIVPERNLAIIELSQAAGLHLVPAHLRNPLKTTTTGVGDLIKDSINKGCKKIIIGVGDSATIDCGIGALSSLGVRFLDKHLEPIEPNCSGLLNLYKIDDRPIEGLRSIEFIILADVSNPLTGKNGALVYAKQKGARIKDLPIIEQALKNFKKIVWQQYGINLDSIKGTGAAGGIAGGMYAILNAKIILGFDYFEKIFSLNRNIKDADLVITGEGKIDKTTFSGKATGRIIKLCYKYQKPVILVCGNYDPNLNLKKYRIIKIYSLLRITKNKKTAMLKPEKFLEKIGSEIALALLDKSFVH